MTIRYTGLIAPSEVPTGDGRIFAAGKGTYRIPSTAMAKFESGGHQNAVVVGKLVRAFEGAGGMWGTIEFLNPEIVPDVVKACYMLDQGVLGPSVDLDQDYTVQPIPHPKRVDARAAYFTSYNVVGVTLVPMPAFAEVHLSADMEPERALLASAGMAVNSLDRFDINARAWDAWPLAPREYKYDADDAVKRIAQWAGIGTKTPSLDHYASAFLWRDGSQAGDTLAQDSFRLPLADIVNGEPHLIYHAVYAAAALLSGGHGGLPNIPQSDQEQMKLVINQIYEKMAQQFGDSGMTSPFMPGGGRQDTQASLAAPDGCGCEFAAAEPYGDVEYADPGYRDSKKRYPIDTPEHIRAAWSYINQAGNASQYSSTELKAIRSRIMAAAKRAGIEISEEATEGEMALTASVIPVAPPRSWFDAPKFSAPQPWTVTSEGRVFGHLASWKTCHVGIGNACVVAPKSKTGYRYFTLGSVVCDDGSVVNCGVVSFGAAHANEKWGVMPARAHYDNSAMAGAVVTIGEDRHGIWVAGALTPNLTEAQVAELRRSKLSGDWRAVEGNLELIAALGVNAPGFPVLHTHGENLFSAQGVGMIETFTTEEVADQRMREFVQQRMAEIEAKEEARRGAGRGKRLAEIDARQQQLAASSQSTIIARQQDAQFQQIAEPAE